MRASSFTTYLPTNPVAPNTVAVAPETLDRPPGPARVGVLRSARVDIPAALLPPLLLPLVLHTPLLRAAMAATAVPAWPVFVGGGGGMGLPGWSCSRRPQPEAALPLHTPPATLLGGGALAHLRAETCFIIYKAAKQQAVAAKAPDRPQHLAVFLSQQLHRPHPTP